MMSESHTLRRLFHQYEQHVTGTRIMSKSALKRCIRDIERFEKKTAELHEEAWQEDVQQKAKKFTPWWKSDASGGRDASVDKRAN